MMSAIGIREELCNQRTVAHTNLNLWRIAGASVRGTSHEKREQPCQDAHYWRVLPEGVLVAAVADGAGSAALSDVGAIVAARTAVESVSSQMTSSFGWESRRKPQGVGFHRGFSERERATWQLSENSGNWRQLLMNALRTTRTALEIEAAERRVKLRDLATTLILITAMPELIVVTQVGDGAVVAGDVRGNVIPLTTSQSGEYINQTNFLTSNDALDIPQVTLCRGSLSHIAVFSDGLQMLALKMAEYVPHKPFFSPLFRFVTEIRDEAEAKEELELFLRSKRVRERTDDDLTLLLATLQ